MDKLYRIAGYLRLSKEDGDTEESNSIMSQRSIVEYLKDIEKDKVLIFRKQRELNKWLRDFIKIQSKIE